MYKYLYWHYTKGVKRYLEIWRDFIWFFWNFFSIPLLLRTLFSYWHRDITRMGRGFDPKEFLQTLAFNFISRGVGAVVRLFTILFALIIEILIILFGAVFFIVWLGLPLVAVGSLISGFLLVFTSRIVEGTVLLFSAGLLFILPGIFYFIAGRKFPSQMVFDEMMKESWFNLVWQRMGIDPLAYGKISPDKIAAISKEQDLTREDFNEIVEWVAGQYEERMKSKMFWLRENMTQHHGIGKEWAYGYTVNLDRFAKNISAPHSGKLIGREKELEMMERILARADENNILVIGEPGTGRKTITREFAELVYKGQVLPPLRHKRVLELNLGAVTAGSLNISEMEARLRTVLNEAVSAGNVILVIDDFHNFIGRQEGLGKIDVSGILMPYLQSKHIQIIGIVTYAGLHKNIEANPELLKYFEKVEIKEPDEKNSLLILQDIAPKMEARTGIIATHNALKAIIDKSGQYFSDVAMPERAIDLLDEALIYARTKTADSYLKPEHVDLIISEKTEVPTGAISDNEKQKLANLEEILHKRIVNQEEAVKAVASAMRRARLGIAEKKKPMGSFLFLGPTGVGKTETAKVLTEAYFGKEERMIRLDMSEFQNVYDVNRLIGSPDGEQGFLTSQVKENPFSLVLFDEVEKAHPNILNLFLQVLDEGWLTDGWGRKISFRNCIIIATSNAGTELIRQMVEQGVDPVTEREKVLNYLQENNIFRPEFLNRFDGVIVFHPLTKENLIKIAELMLNGLNKRLAEQKINLVITPELVERIAELGYDPEYGARPMRRVIQDKIEDLISRKLLDESLQKGESVEIKAKEI